MPFQLNSQYKPAGDQPQAIEQLTEGILQGEHYQTLLGVTGSGKTFTMANVIQNVQRPTLVLLIIKPWLHNCMVNFGNFSPIILLGILFLIMIIISRKLICLLVMFILKKI